MLIRNAEISDLDAILALYRTGLARELDLLNQIVPGKSVNTAGFGELKNMLIQMIKTDECRFFIATENDRLLGYCLATKKAYPVELPKLCGCINGIFVIPEARRSGLGAKLFDAAKDWFRSQKITLVDLYYSLNDHDAQAFWHKLGFTPIQMNCLKVL